MILLDAHIWFRWQNNNDLLIKWFYHIEQINKEIALLAKKLANHHKDPEDRFIIATSVFYQLPIISLDTAFPKYLEIKNLLIH